MTTINVLVYAFLIIVFFCLATCGFFLLHGMTSHFFLLSVYFPTRSRCFLNATGAILRINLKPQTNNQRSPLFSKPLLHEAVVVQIERVGRLANFASEPFRAIVALYRKKGYPCYSCHLVVFRKLASRF